MKTTENYTLLTAAARALAVCILLCVISKGALAEDAFGNIRNTRSSLEKWVETQRIISKEKEELKISREMLNERIGLLSREIDSLRSKITDAEESIAEADKKREAMIEENEKLKEASSSLVEVIAKMEQRTKEMLKRLPDPIRNRVKPLSQRLPEDAGETKLSVSERFQNVVGILNEVDKFNREITVTSEVRTLEDGSSVEVASMYIGIGQGFYVSANGQIAGVGLAGPRSWKWKTDDQAAAQIAEAIAIMKNEKVASFVKLPVEIN
jgi:FtsZ-binding cell division protein ZapB